MFFPSDTDSRFELDFTSKKLGDLGLTTEGGGEIWGAKIYFSCVCISQEI